MAGFRWFLVTTGLLGFTTARSNCYYPNGAINNSYVPCNPDAPYSACCASTDECLTNGLCRPANSQFTGNDFWRDLCTDPLWQSDACPKFCYNDTIAPTAAQGTYFVTSCSWDTYCCADLGVWDSGDTTACCSDKTALFNGGPAKWQKGPHVSTITYSRPASTSGGSSSTTSTPTSASTITSTPASQTSNSPLPTPSDAQDATTTSSSGLSTGAKAGIGVAVAVAVIAVIIAVAALVLLRRSRKQKAKDEGATNPAWGGSPEGKSVYAHYSPAPTGVEQYYDPPPPVKNIPAQEMEAQRLQELPGQGNKHPASTNLPEMES